jgi:hypothetical protein
MAAATPFRIPRGKGADLLLQLASRGHAAVDLALPASALQGVHDDLTALQEQPGRSRSAGQGSAAAFFEQTQQPRHRGDRIAWLGLDDAVSRYGSSIQGALSVVLEQVPALLASARPAGGGDIRGPLQAPAKAMMSLYQDGAQYRPHTDGVLGSDLGAIGGLLAAKRAFFGRRGEGASLHRALAHLAYCSSDLRYREYTAILYLNAADWPRSDGGQLQLFPGAEAGDETGESASEVVEIVPAGGTLVVFDSRSMLHAVTPSLKPRIALTAWLEHVSARYASSKSNSLLALA